MSKLTSSYIGETMTTSIMEPAWLATSRARSQMSKLSWKLLGLPRAELIRRLTHGPKSKSKSNCKTNYKSNYKTNYCSNYM